MSKSKTLDKFIQYTEHREISKSCIQSLLSKSNKNNIIIRPHPFEKKDYYFNYIKNKPENIKISDIDDIHDEINHCDLIIQSGCQTSLDGFMRGIPSIRFVEEKINIWSHITPYVDINLLE